MTPATRARPDAPSDARGTITLTIDPHVHTDGSYDCETPLADVLERAAERGLDGLCITDHDTIERSLAAARIAPEYGLFAIPGVEVSTQDGHVLAFGVETRPEPGRSFAETIARIRERGGLAIVPHPFRRSRHGVAAATIDDHGCDGIEVHNAMGMIGVRNRQAARFARRRDLPGVAGSDAHAPRTIGRSVTEVHLDPGLEREADTALEGGANAADRLEPERLERDVLEAVAAGRTTPRGALASPVRCVRKYARNVSMKLRSSVGFGADRLERGTLE